MVIYIFRKSDGWCHLKMNIISLPTNSNVVYVLNITSYAEYAMGTISEHSIVFGSDILKVLSKTAAICGKRYT